MSNGSRGTGNVTRWRRRKAFLALVFISALTTATLGGTAGASHTRFEQLSAGQVNGNGAFDVTFGGASADGARVFFQTDEQLVAADTDNAQDIYERSGGLTKLVSAGQVNGNGGFDATFQRASSDGTRIFFHSAEQLVTADTDLSQDIYERSGGQTKRVSAGQVNGNGPFAATFRGASTDGSKVFFETNEGLIGGDTDTSTDVYERSGGSTKRVSTGQVNGNGANNASFQGTSADGTRVFFHTAEQLTADDGDINQDVYQRSAGQTTRVSAGQINGNGPFAAFAGASADGSRVFFLSTEKLVTADTDNVQDVYERSGGTTTKVSSGNGSQAASFRGASTDGLRVFFDTSEQLVGADTDGAKDLYERSGGQTKRVSAGQVNGNGAFDASFRGSSADGSRVFFETQEQLVSADNDSSTDLYERASGNTKLLSAGQVNGNGNFNASFRGASADGSRVFFRTQEVLVPGDADGNLDIYERFSGTTTKVSAGSALAAAAEFAGASTDGSAVFFTTADSVIGDDLDSSIDLYGAYLVP